MGQATYSEEIAAPPETVWAYISDVTKFPQWAYREGRFPYLVEGRYGSEQQAGVGTIWVGQSSDGQSANQQVVAWEPPHKLAYELQDAENAPSPMEQTNTFVLEPTEGGTKITWTLDWQLTGGFSFNALLFRFTGNGAFEEMIAGSLENLKKLVEEGDSKPKI